MKRSEINKIIAEAIDFFRSMNFFLPPFAYFSIREWQKISASAKEIFDLNLGWDVTDFGLGDFETCGLLLFTIRNGQLKSDNIREIFCREDHDRQKRTGDPPAFSLG